jgi:hypothetical protein
MKNRLLLLLTLTIIAKNLTCQPVDPPPEDDDEGPYEDELANRPTEYTTNSYYSIKLPLNVKNLKSRFWFSGGIMLNKNSLQLSDGKAEGKSLMGTTKKISHDDEFILEMSLKMDKKVYKRAGSELTSDDVALLVIQFSKDLFNFTYKPTENDTLVLDGLIFFLFNDTLTEKGYIAYRYFKESTAVNRKYILSLFPLNEDKGAKDDRFCEISSIQNFDRLRISVDYVNKFHLMLEYSLVQQTDFDRCFVIPNIMRYLSAENAFFSLKVSNGSNIGFKVGMYNMELREKKHALDIHEDLQISHALVEEIFDKVKTFTAEYNSDKEHLSNIMSAMDKVEHYSNFLRIFSKDLNNGTKIMQENMMEYINRNNYLTMNDFPQLQKIKEKMDNIEKKQNVIYSRFRDITDIINNKRVFRKLNKRFKGVDKIMNTLLETINSDDFEQLNNRTVKLLEFMKDVNFKKLLKKAKKIIKNEEKSFYMSAGNFGFFAIGLICVLLFLVSCGIIRNISKAEKEHIL